MRLLTIGYFLYKETFNFFIYIQYIYIHLYRTCAPVNICLYCSLCWFVYILVHCLDTNILYHVYDIINLCFVNSILIDYKFHFIYQQKHMSKITITPSPRTMCLLNNRIVFIIFIICCCIVCPYIFLLLLVIYVVWMPLVTFCFV